MEKSLGYVGKVEKGLDKFKKNNSVKRYFEKFTY